MSLPEGQMVSVSGFALSGEVSFMDFGLPSGAWTRRMSEIRPSVSDRRRIVSSESMRQTFDFYVFREHLHLTDPRVIASHNHTMPILNFSSYTIDALHTQSVWLILYPH